MVQGYSIAEFGLWVFYRQITPLSRRNKARGLTLKDLFIIRFEAKAELIQDSEPILLDAPPHLLQVAYSADLALFFSHFDSTIMHR